MTQSYKTKEGENKPGQWMQESFPVSQHSLILQLEKLLLLHLHLLNVLSLSLSWRKDEVGEWGIYLPLTAHTQQKLKRCAARSSLLQEL